MADRFVYADEAGCFAFKHANNVSRYFIIVTISMVDWTDATIGMQKLRHDLIADGLNVRDYFHAVNDDWPVRKRVFDEILKYNFKIQATICEKAKAQPNVTKSKARFFQVPWFYHVKRGLAPFLTPEDNLMVTAASIGSTKERAAMVGALDDVMSQILQPGKWNVDFRSCKMDVCMQIADYCAWAIQRKWERGEIVFYDQIKDRITREYNLWGHGTKLYY